MNRKSDGLAKAFIEIARSNQVRTWYCEGSCQKRTSQDYYPDDLRGKEKYVCRSCGYVKVYITK